MKLLLDENLSDRIIHRIVYLYPNSEHVKTFGLTNTDVVLIWEYAKANGFVIVSKDSDFHQMSFLLGAPPKVIWLRCGNSTVAEVEQLLRLNLQAIHEFETKPDSPLLEIWP